MADGEAPGESTWQIIVGVITTMCMLLYCILDQCGDVVATVLLTPVSCWLGSKLWVSGVVLGAAIALISTACIAIYSMLNKDDFTPKSH